MRSRAHEHHAEAQPATLALPPLPVDGLQLHLGSGPHVEPGWVNVDKSWMALVSRIRPLVRALAHIGLLSERQATTRWPRDVVRRNLARPFSWADGSARAIYSSHMLEHLDRAEARAFLTECKRVLRPGGVLRLALPNLETLVRHYQRAKEAGDSHAADEFVEFLYLLPLGAGEPWPRRMVLTLLHRAHRWMYDPESLTSLLRDIGFVQVEECGFRTGACPDLGTLETRQSELYEASSFYVEGFKP